MLTPDAGTGWETAEDESERAEQRAAQRRAGALLTRARFLRAVARGSSLVPLLLRSLAIAVGDRHCRWRCFGSQLATRGGVSEAALTASRCPMAAGDGTPPGQRLRRRSLAHRERAGGVTRRTASSGLGPDTLASRWSSARSRERSSPVSSTPAPSTRSATSSMALPDYRSTTTP